MTFALSLLFRIAPQQFKSSPLSINNCTCEAEMTIKKSGTDRLLGALIGSARDQGTLLSHPYVSSYRVSLMETGTIIASNKSLGWYWTHFLRRNLSQKAPTFFIRGSMPKGRNGFEIFFFFISKLVKLIYVCSPKALSLFFLFLNWAFSLETQSEGVIIIHKAYSFH